MPVPKRYFHVSQEINLDPDVWELTEKFGDRSMRTWLQILVFLDRTENRWRMTGESLKNLSRIVRQQSASISRQVLWMISSGWLTVLETSPDGSPAILMSPNWAKYNRRQEHKRSEFVPVSGTKRERIEAPSFPTPTPFLSVPKEEEKKEEDKTIVGLPLNGAALWRDAEEVISFLNEKTGKHFQSRHPNGDPTKSLQAVHSLLKKGYTLVNLRMVVANRCLKWRDDPKMEEFLRPETLFSPSKFSNYFGELGKGMNHERSSLPGM
jgi:uncharacterized phage protein (TIGR02220 family)